MNPKNKPTLLKRRLLQGTLAVSLLALLPHLVEGTDINDGMRIGNPANTNTLTSLSSIAVGEGNYVSADRSLAVGQGNGLVAGGYGAIAAGYGNYLSGPSSYAFGQWQEVYGSASMAIGYDNTVDAHYSLAIGLENQVSSSAYGAIAGGRKNIADADYSVALGYYSTAKTYCSMVVGQFNDVTPGEWDAAAKTTWRPADPLFVVGNGLSPSMTKNALVITKDGTVNIYKVPPKGGISMGIYTAPAP